MVPQGASPLRGLSIPAAGRRRRTQPKRSDRRQLRRCRLPACTETTSAACALARFDTVVSRKRTRVSRKRTMIDHKPGRVGRVLHELRVRRGFSLDEVARRTGISRAYLWRLEKGRSTNPSDVVAQSIADCFGITRSHLHGEPSRPSSFESDAGLVRLSHWLTPIQRRQILDLMMSLAKANGHELEPLPTPGSSSDPAAAAAQPRA